MIRQQIQEINMPTILILIALKIHEITHIIKYACALIPINNAQHGFIYNNYIYLSFFL